MAKTYQLVAWTDKGQVKMLPSALREYAREYIEPIERLLAFWEEGWCREKGSLQEKDVVELSRLYEAYGRFLQAHGKRQEAFEAYINGAWVSLDDRFVVDSDLGYVLVGILPKRYHFLAGLCRDLIDEDAALARLPKWQELRERYRIFDRPFAREREEERREMSLNKAYYFGR